MAQSRVSKSVKSKKSLNWWYLLPIVIIIAAVGYLVVRYSKAASYTTITPDKPQTNYYAPTFAGCKKAVDTGYGPVWDITIFASRPYVTNTTSRNLTTEVSYEVIRPEKANSVVLSGSNNAWWNNTTTVLNFAVSRYYKDRINLKYRIWIDTYNYVNLYDPGLLKDCS